MSLVELGMTYFPDPTTGRPVYFGSIYVGNPDTDPTLVVNQKTVRLRQQDGSEVVSAQPILTGAGGMPVYNGSPIQILTDGDYSIAVLDRNGTQVYYIPAGSSLTALGAIRPLIEFQVAIEGQTLFTLNNFTYTPGANDLIVYRNGRLQYGPNSDSPAYTEVSSNQIQFSEALAAGEEIRFATNELEASASSLEGSATPQVGKAALWDGLNPESTTIELEDVTDAVNTSGKRLGFQRVNSTTGRIVYAAGSLASDVWKFFDGTTAHTPI